MNWWHRFFLRFRTIGPVSVGPLAVFSRWNRFAYPIRLVIHGIRFVIHGIRFVKLFSVVIRISKRPYLGFEIVERVAIYEGNSFTDFPRVREVQWKAFHSNHKNRNGR